MDAFSGRPAWALALILRAMQPHADQVDTGTVAVLEQADAFGTHAGMGGCGEGLLAGVPMVAVSQAAEQSTGLGVAQIHGRVMFMSFEGDERASTV